MELERAVANTGEKHEALSVGLDQATDLLTLRDEWLRGSVIADSKGDPDCTLPNLNQAVITSNC